MKKVASFAEYCQKHEEWSALLLKLQSLIAKTELQETIKWGAPTYTLDDKNVVGVGAFKSYAGLWFFNGALLKDKQGVLINAQDGKTKAMRQWRFNDISEVDDKLILAYLKEAIANQSQGKVVPKAKPSKEVTIPEELQELFDKKKPLYKKFLELTPYKQKEYAEHISSAKRQATRESRLQKCIPLIEKGVGLNDKYRNC